MQNLIDIKHNLQILWIKRFPRGLNTLFFLYILIMVFMGELFVMACLPYVLPQHHQRFLESLADSLFLSLLIAPGLYPLLRGFSQRLRRTERVLENLQEGYWLLDRNGQLIDVNEGYCSLIGYNRDELMSINIDYLSANNTSSFINSILQQIEKTENITPIETRQKCKNGQIIDIEASVALEVETNFIVVFLRDISKRKLDFLALKNTTRRLEYFVEHSATVIFAVQIQPEQIQTIWVSANLPRILGYSIEEAMQSNWWGEHLCLEDKEAVLAKTSGLLTGLVQEDYEYRFLHKDGRVRWIHDRQQEMRDENGQNYVVISWTDITEQKITEKAVIVSEQAAQNSLFLLEQQRFAIDQHTIMSISNLKGQITYVNDKFCQISGYSRDELLGQNHRILNSRKHSKQFFQEMYAFLSRGSVWQAEMCNRDKNGNLIYLETTIAPLRNNEEEIQGYMAIRTDVTHRKLMEKELKLSAITFEVQEGVMITDADNLIIRVNLAFSRLTGYKAEEVIGKNPSLLKSYKHDGKYYKEMWNAITNQHYWQGEIWNQRKNGEIYPEWLTITAITDEAGAIINYVGIFSDISKDKEYTQTIYNLAFYDSLTSLPNRRLFLDRLKHAIENLARSEKHGALLFIDLDNFKRLNDTKGHHFGDRLLKMVAERLLSCVRVNDTVARLGGDEFVIMLEGLSDDLDQAKVQAELVGEKVLAATSIAYKIINQDFNCTVSVGISLYDHTSNDDELLKQADTAMYQSKAAGRNTLRFFNQEMFLQLEDRISLEIDLFQALVKQQFKLYFQPQVIEGTGIIAAEVLLRWIHPERGFVPPDKFIPIAEEIGVIGEIGDWVLSNACQQLKQWEDNLLLQHLVLAVNVSPCQFRQPDFVYKVAETIRTAEIEPNKLKLEITETTIIEDIEITIAKMHALKKIGVTFSMDDFGTGHSSLAVLKKLPLDQLKIDKSFVIDLPNDVNDSIIAKTIIAMSTTLGLSVVAEGVETEDQRKFLSSNGCSIHQGYAYSKPVPLEEFMLLLDAESKIPGRDNQFQLFTQT